MRWKLTALALFAAASLSITFLLPDPVPNETPVEKKSLVQEGLARISQFNPKTVVEHPFEAITDPPMKDAAEGSRSLGDKMLVLGVNYNGVAKAYPVSMLYGPKREIINDTFGDHPLAATW